MPVIAHIMLALVYITASVLGAVALPLDLGLLLERPRLLVLQVEHVLHAAGDRDEEEDGGEIRNRPVAPVAELRAAE